MPADAVPLKRQQVHDLYADPTHIAAAGKIISEAENPVILVGTGAVRAMRRLPSPKWPTACTSRWSTP